MVKFFIHFLFLTVLVTVNAKKSVEEATSSLSIAIDAKPLKTKTVNNEGKKDKDNQGSYSFLSLSSSSFTYNPNPGSESSSVSIDPSNKNDKDNEESIISVSSFFSLTSKQSSETVTSSVPTDTKDKESQGSPSLVSLSPSSFTSNQNSVTTTSYASTGQLSSSSESVNYTETSTAATKSSSIGTLVSTTTSNSTAITSPYYSSSRGSGRSSSDISIDVQSLTKEQFDECVAAYAISGFGKPPPPSAQVYDAYRKYVVPQMPTLEEQAMFLANSIWETGGLQYVEEIACKKGTCKYGKYYGRGYIQLTWKYNYKAASQDLFKDNRLVENPQSVTTPEIAWQTAVWFWMKRVRSTVDDATIKSRDFGATVKVINGILECAGSPNGKAQKRLKIYNAIRKIIGLSGYGNLKGCK